MLKALGWLLVAPGLIAAAIAVAVGLLFCVAIVLDAIGGVETAQLILMGAVIAIAFIVGVSLLITGYR